MATWTVGETLRSHEPDILREWEARAHHIAVLRLLAPDELRDSVPRLLDQIARACDALVEGGDPDIASDIVAGHAQERLDEGAGLRDVVTEYALLRESIVRALSTATAAQMFAIHRAIDHAIASSVDHFARARERAMHALDRISTAALASSNLDELLRALLSALVETTPVVNTAAVLLCDGDALRLRAAVGLEREMDLGFTLRIGEGFSGTIAATGRPLFVRHAAVDPLVKSPLLRRNGVRALYGVPLVHDGRVIGVANVGSCTSFELSREDRRLVTVMAARLTSVIARQKLIDELATERARFTQVIEELPVAVYLAEPPSGRIVYGNRTARELDRKATSGQADLLPRWELRTHAGEPMTDERYPIVRALQGETVRSETAVLQTEQGERVVSIFAKPIRESDDTIREAVLVANDFTELHALIAERDARIAGERSAREEAERASRLREDVLAVVSHDLKNPISAILLGADAAEKMLERGEVLRGIETIERLRRAATRMDDLVHDLLDAARIDARTLPLDLDVVPVSKLVVDCLDAEAPIADRRGVELRYELATEGSARCDARRVGQVLANLTGNALQFTPRGGHVLLGAREEEHEVELWVSDDGPGVADDVLPHLFDRFHRSTRAEGAGAGLGLYIARGIVEAHGGKISVETVKGRGTTFRFTLPRASASAGTFSPKARPHPLGAS